MRNTQQQTHLNRIQYCASALQLGLDSAKTRDGDDVNARGDWAEKLHRESSDLYTTNFNCDNSNKPDGEAKTTRGENGRQRWFT